MARISRLKMFADIAQIVALRSSCGRAKNSALIIRDGRIIVTGYNNPVKGMGECSKACFELGKTGCINAVHAEANAIYFAARHGINVEGCTIVCTMSPCRKCAEAIVQAGITDVIYLEQYRDESSLYYLTSLGITVQQYDNRTDTISYSTKYSSGKDPDRVL